MKNILITGVAGFVGYSMAKYLLESKKNKIFGIDNLNKYYSLNLKKKRLENLKSKNFKFIKLDISRYERLEKIFKKIKFDCVYNFAAQPGVRYSISNPEVYVKSNIDGFFNLIDISKNYKVKKFIYCSSSSVYGETKKFPLTENSKKKPNNFYGLTKSYNEEIAQNYFDFYKFNSIGLRLFTVYGEWGRPDMFILKFMKAFRDKKKFQLYNSGNHYRDFTYIHDAIKMIIKLSKKDVKKHQIYNVCTGKSLHIKNIVKKLYKKKITPELLNVTKQRGDVYKTHGTNKKILKTIGNIKFTNFDAVLNRIVKWYETNGKYL